MSFTHNRGNARRANPFTGRGGRAGGNTGRDTGRSGTPLNASADEFSPQAAAIVGRQSGRQTEPVANYRLHQHRQTLRETSERDESPGSRTHHGAIGAPIPAAARAANTAGAAFGGGVPLQGAPGPVGAAIPPALQALLATGPVTVSMRVERERPGADANFPAFLKGITFDHNNPLLWYNVVLPYVQGLTFNIGFSPDCMFMADVLGSPNHPQLFEAITKMDLSCFHWFSGIQQNRSKNPYFGMASHLPSLGFLSFKLHTGNLTTSVFGERRMLAIEAVDEERSKERKCRAPEEVIAYYGLGDVFAFRSLRILRIEYIACARTAHYTLRGDPVRVIRDIRNWLEAGFANQGHMVRVEMVQVED
ncbi:hypothetical protein N0V83_001951 [Neocucurbitaria cava]|uniref:Uncharacterized protein n=1 Tax=Neocucurbitaria cava TaxID=798079 RepID=A0A9W9CQC5_9PLEO|nr:hypothetical protein N0V83_001951 [Neocucurbitaria cava]